jgi:hypothetical protein
MLRAYNDFSGRPKSEIPENAWQLGVHQMPRAESSGKETQLPARRWIRPW